MIGLMRPAGFDDSLRGHAAAALGADVEIAAGELEHPLSIVRWHLSRAGRRDGEQPAHMSYLGGTLAVGEEPVMTDAVEARGNDVEHEPADELVGPRVMTLVLSWWR